MYFMFNLNKILFNFYLLLTISAVISCNVQAGVAGKQTNKYINKY